MTDKLQVTWTQMEDIDERPLTTEEIDKVVDQICKEIEKQKKEYIKPSLFDRLKLKLRRQK